MMERAAGKPPENNSFMAADKPREIILRTPLLSSLVAMAGQEKGEGSPLADLIAEILELCYASARCDHQA
jgi:hypothetical protein